MIAQHALQTASKVDGRFVRGEHAINVMEGVRLTGTWQIEHYYRTIEPEHNCKIDNDIVVTPDFFYTATTVDSVTVVIWYLLAFKLKEGALREEQLHKAVLVEDVGQSKVA